MGRSFDSWQGLILPFELHGAHAYADLCRTAAEEPAWADCTDPLPVLHALRMASFAGRANDPFDGDTNAFRADLVALDTDLRRAAQRGLVQFTEPLRVADVLPGLLLASQWTGGRPLRLVEIGSSVGLLLAPQVFRIRYPNGTWDPPDALCELVSDLHVPEHLLAQPLKISARIGIDLSPVDPLDPGAYDYLRAFTWPGDPRREPRLRDALTALGADPPPLMQGDALSCLADQVPRGRDVTVIVESALASYLTDRQAMRLGRMLDALSAKTHLMFLTRSPQSEDPVLSTAMTLIDLTLRRRLTYALGDMLSERTRWVGSEPGTPPTR